MYKIFWTLTLYTYPVEARTSLGKEQEFYLSPRLDNLAMSFAGHRAFLELAETSLLGEGFQGSPSSTSPTMKRLVRGQEQGL